VNTTAEQEKIGEGEKFRDHLGSITESGKRNWIFPRKPKGKYYRWRTILSWLYVITFFALPFLRVDGHPLFLFDVLERKFVLFGVIFWPQDFIIFGIGMLTFMVFVVLFTIAFGRVFCGWICPQTIFMEMIFRKVEYWIDGDAEAQRKLAKRSWDTDKIIRRVSKFSLFLLMSAVITHTFLAYVIGTDELWNLMTSPVGEHAGGFTGMIIFTLIFFFIYSWFREQVCIIVCPYGRLQGVLLDRNSIVVAYDYVRGEPRSKHQGKNKVQSGGDCVDCSLCVKACPTGIDIRNGTQLECVNCTACIDACDAVMEKVHKPKSLIRYASENGIKEGKKLGWTPRLKAYTAVLALLIGVLVTLLVTRTDVDATVLRAGGQLFHERENNQITNLYTVKVINKTRDSMPVTFKIESGDGTIEMVGKPLTVQKESKGETTFFIVRDREKIKHRKTKIRISVWSGDTRLQTVSTTFLGPVNRN
jgi:cytochrome c oxidase accessory protein FixG